jgi:uncharacterized protein
MKCPSCPDSTLAMSDRQGVEIDYCSQCRGVWLDRGELDKLVERAAAPEPGRNTASSPASSSRQDFVDSDYHEHGGRYPVRRKKSWLGEIFD